MVSAWEVYLVLQLDSIGNFFTFLSIVLLFAGGINVFIASVFTDRGCRPSEAQDAAWARAKRISAWAVLLALLPGCVAALLPSSKTAAAMIVLPALTSEEVTKPLAKEAADLYRLAKRALADVVDAPKEEAKE